MISAPTTRSSHCLHSSVAHCRRCRRPSGTVQEPTSPEVLSFEKQFMLQIDVEWGWPQYEVRQLEPSPQPHALRAPWCETYRPLFQQHRRSTESGLSRSAAQSCEHTSAGLASVLRVVETSCFLAYRCSLLCSGGFCQERCRLRSFDAVTASLLRTLDAVVAHCHSSLCH